MLNSINYINSNPKFGHGHSYSNSTYNKHEKRLIATTTALGVIGSLAYLSKSAGYSLKPQKMFKNIKNSYLVKAPYNDEKDIITIGAGSCLGGLLGGCIVDKNKQNRKAKLQETLLQIANISLPALFTVRFAKAGEYLGNKFLEKNPLKSTYKTTIAKSTAAMTGLILGVYFSNIVANKVNEIIFKQGKGRPVKLSDFSAHLDDMCLAARQFGEHPLINAVSMFIPVALMTAGNEIGNKQAN